MSKITVALAALALSALPGCATQQPTVFTVEHVDLPRFMGRWFVIANIPTVLEKHAYNATETYQLSPDGTIAVTFEFHKGAFDGPLKSYHPTGFVQDASNAYWKVQFFWPIKAEYRVSYLDAGYSQVIIARTARDNVWIMARTPSVSDEDYRKLVSRVRDLGYDTDKLQRVPQQWP